MKDVPSKVSRRTKGALCGVLSHICRQRYIADKGVLYERNTCVSMLVCECMVMHALETNIFPCQSFIVTIRFGF